MNPNKNRLQSQHKRKKERKKERNAIHQVYDVI